MGIGKVGLGPVITQIVSFSKINMAYVNEIDSLGGAVASFSQGTIDNQYLNPSNKTHLLDVAQGFLGKIEVTKDEYKKLTDDERKNTQASVISKGRPIEDQFCAHTVSTISKEAGMDIGGHKMRVTAFINWADGREVWTALPDNLNSCTNVNNVEQYRKDRDVYIREHLKEMQEGDFIVWKSPSFYVKTSANTYEKTSRSHIGIIESVDLKNGTVTVIEGNANVLESGEDYEGSKVKTKEEGITGNQAVGEFKEVNQRDGIIRKVYTIQDLVNWGYTGFISNQNIVPKKLNAVA